MHSRLLFPAFFHRQAFGCFRRPVRTEGAGLGPGFFAFGVHSHFRLYASSWGLLQTVFVFQTCAGALGRAAVIPAVPYLPQIADAGNDNMHVVMSVAHCRPGMIRKAQGVAPGKWTPGSNR